ncbi:MAG: phosphocholine cytidylyltransferase family protein [Nitrospirae bacterium]|nr:phosphocholine cytidylyltransferase family protein [Nitrospirota bacterium]
MKAIILAAGGGKRLWGITKEIPKPLIQLGGKSLLRRHMENLVALGIREVVLVVGYKQELIRQEMAKFPQDIQVHFLVNEDYVRGSIGSLWVARSEFTDDMVIMDADVLYHPAILDRLLKSPLENVLLMDETVHQKTEECMVVVRDQRVIALTKHMPQEYDEAGEGVGFLKVGKSSSPKLIDSLGDCIQDNKLDLEYEDALKNFFCEVLVGYEKIGGLPWIEIDFPEDIERAEHDILPQLP